MLKDLKMACATYGPTAPFSLAMMEGIQTDALAPNDWKTLAIACLSGGDYLLWKSEFAELCKQQTQRNKAHQVRIRYDMLVGEGQYSPLVQQLGYPLQAYQQINIARTKAWRSLPTSIQKGKN